MAAVLKKSWHVLSMLPVYLVSEFKEDPSFRCFCSKSTFLKHSTSVRIKGQNQLALLFSVPYGKLQYLFLGKGRHDSRVSNSKLSAECMLFSTVIFLSLFNSIFFITFVIVSLPWRWWRRGVWQHCKWWSKISTISIYRSHLYNETGKNIIIMLQYSPLTVFSPTLRKLITFVRNKILSEPMLCIIFLQLNFRLAPFMLCCAARPLKWKL